MRREECLRNGRRKTANSGARTNVVAVAVTVLVAIAVTGCSPKKLSKEEATSLLKDVPSTPPTCSLEGGATKAIPVGDDVNRMVTFDDEEWGKLASELAFLKDIKCDPAKTEGKCRALTPQAQLDCTQPLPYFASGDCTFTRPCGSTALEVDSIVTEGTRATIRYSLKPTVEPKVAAIKSPLSSKLHIKDRDVIARTATAVRTDDGKWLLEK